VRQHQRVVVDVDDAALWRDCLGDLVGIVGAGKAGADVKKLANTGLTGQIQTERALNAREARATAMMSGKIAANWSPTSRSTG
jgi:hypothetical protein